MTLSDTLIWAVTVQVVLFDFAVVVYGLTAMYYKIKEVRAKL